MAPALGQYFPWTEAYASNERTSVVGLVRRKGKKVKEKGNGINLPDDAAVVTSQ